MQHNYKDLSIESLMEELVFVKEENEKLHKLIDELKEEINNSVQSDPNYFAC